MGKNKKGFTLIELLAVIVILAIIALIATPIVLNIINGVGKASFQRSAEGILKASKLHYSSNLLQIDAIEDIIFNCDNNECISDKTDIKGNLLKLDIDGNMGSGIVTIKKDGKILFSLTNNKYCAIKYEANDNIIVQDGDCNNVDLTNDTTSPVINSVNTSTTTNSITIVVGATDSESGVYGYQYSIDNGTTYTEIKRSNVYTYNGIKNDKEYEVKVKVYNGTYGKDTYSDEKGMSESETKTVSLSIMSAPSIEVTPGGWSKEKEITIDYKGAVVKEYSIDNGNSFVEYTNSFKISENITIIAKASDGTNSITSTEQVNKIDKELPTVEVSDINTSYEKKDEITLMLSDSLSGVTQYCVTNETTSDNCNWEDGNESVRYIVNTNGTYNAYAKDLAGNISEAKEFTIDKIDTIDPEASLEVTNKTTNTITVRATCSDNIGITKYEYSYDNGNNYEIGENETYTFEELPNGTYNMKVRCSDEAGNSDIGNATDTTEDLSVPTYSVSNSGNWSSSKTVTISYPEGYINEYIIESGSATKEDGTELTNGTWYTASDKQEKVIFTSNGNISARTSDGVNTVTASSQTISGIDTTGPTYTGVEIKNVTSTGYDVYIYGVTDTESGVNTVLFPTWTSNNDQDDIIWSHGTNQGNGTWYYRVNASDHNNESGFYNTHIYLLDNLGNSNGIATSGAMLPITYSYIDQEQSFVAPVTGTYKIELWGASGSSTGLADSFGRGAYTSGTISLNKDEKIYIYVGGSGVYTTDPNGYVYSEGGYNGGGAGESSGGGATDIRLVNGTWDSFDGLKSRIMVAAGGGGSGHPDHTTSIVSRGDGGTLNGVDSKITCHGTTDYSGHGATQTVGGEPGSLFTGNIDPIKTDTMTGKFGKGGYSLNAAGYYTYASSGGGGGYYGGGHGNHPGDSWTGGGGGSSFISGYDGCDAIDEESTEDNIIHTGQSIYSDYIFSDAVMYAGNEEMPNHDGTGTMIGNSGDGFARITLVE